jgi:tellurite resistance protein
MIIFGFTSLKHVKDKGQFYCPQCTDHKDFRLREPRRWFHLYFVPVIPLDSLGRYVECRQCKGTFIENVLNYDPIAEQNRFRSEVEKATRWVTLKMALADGHVAQEELIEIAVLLKSLLDRDVPVAELEAEAPTVASDEQSVEAFLRTAAGLLNGEGKAKVMRGLLAVALADGNFDKAERAFAKRCGDALLLDPAHTRGLIGEAEDHARRETAA